MSPAVTDENLTMPPEAVFNRYFLEHPDWKIRECYLGRQDPTELVGAIGFDNQFAGLLAEIRDHINQTYEAQRHRVLVKGNNPKLHLDYIKVKREPCANPKVSRSNAVAFRAVGMHFVGITIPLIEELLHASVALTRLGRISAPFGVRPDRLPLCRLLSTLLFSTMLQFVACHELGHHFHGHQGRRSDERGDPLSFYDESPWSDSAPLSTSQLKEIEADGYAVKMVMNNITAVRPRETALRLLDQRHFSQGGEKHLVRSFLLATGAFFAARASGSFELAKLGERTHPPEMARMHFIMTGLRTWCSENNLPDLVHYLSLKRYQKTMRAVLDAVGRSGAVQAVEEQSAFLNSPAGRRYLDWVTREVRPLRTSMDPWRWHLVGEHTGTPAPDQTSL